MNLEVTSFGEVDGTPVKSFTLSNRAGIEVGLISYGATINSIYTPDKNGNMANITNGFDNLKQYLQPHPHFGGTIGRVANRIGKARFTLSNQSYLLAANNGANNLHGGNKGFDRVVWDSEVLEDASKPTVMFSYRSADTEEGFPGNLKAQVTFSLSERNELTIEYQATTDKATPVNFTNHAYFNLKGAGNGDILDHVLMINADKYTPVDNTLIPTGELVAVEGTPLDFRKPETVGARIAQLDGGYDHNYVLNKDKNGFAARLYEKESGRVMEVYTTQPGIQLYTGNFLDGSISGLGGRYNKHGALCLETQHFPDSVNKPNFPSVILNPGETYKQTARYVFSNVG